MSKKLMMIKLITGEELLGEVEERTANYNGRVTVTNPERIILQQTPQGLGIVLMDFIPFAKDTKKVSIDINDNAIAFKFEDIAPDLVANYRQKYSSIILNPNPNPVVTLRT